MKRRCNNVVPECFADTVLVEMLGFTFPNHASSSNVSQVLKIVKESFASEKIVGIIDSDRGKSEKIMKKDEVLKKFNLMEEKNGIKRYTLDNQTILIICPAFEGWVFENASSKSIDPAKHGFHTSQYFRKVCKNIDARNNPSLKQFLNTIKQKKAPGFEQLKTWICEGAGIDKEEM